MDLSVFDLYKIGVGPSSSHTVGPMRAIKRFLSECQAESFWNDISVLKMELYGSLALTGVGHQVDKALILGAMGEDPETVDTTSADDRVRPFLEAKKEVVLSLLAKKDVSFLRKDHLLFHKKKVLPAHPNGMCFSVYDKNGKLLRQMNYYSIGGGFILAENETSSTNGRTKPPYDFNNASELVENCKKNALSMSEVVFENEKTWFSEEEIEQKLDLIWSTMDECIQRGFKKTGLLPGPLKVKRRAPEKYRKLKAAGGKSSMANDPLSVLDWVNLYALSVNEENASGGRVVTAPTNGAAGILPAVISYYREFCPEADREGIKRILLCAGAIGLLYKQNASLSGAEVGCQGEVGVACSMAAGGLTEALGGTVEQVENAAEIAMEHNLGLTCDPVGGLVQIPCIERNAMGAVKAINASRLALKGDGSHHVSLDKVIKTMQQTGKDMQKKYKETSKGGLAAVNITEC